MATQRDERGNASHTNWHSHCVCVRLDFCHCRLCALRFVALPLLLLMLGGRLTFTSTFAIAFACAIGSAFAIAIAIAIAFVPCSSTDAS